MARPRQLSRYFHSDEIPGWSSYSEPEAAIAAEYVRTVLTPARRRWGRIIITDAMTRETGAHSDAGTFDWVPIDELERPRPELGGLAALEVGEAGSDERHEAIADVLEDVGSWVATYLASDVGEVIAEPPPWGGDVTGHIHSTRPGVGSPGAGEFLVEIGPGRFRFGRARASLLALVVAAAAVLTVVAAA